MCKSDDMDAEVFFRRTFSNREVEGICGLTCDNKLADPSSSDDEERKLTCPLEDSCSGCSSPCPALGGRSQLDNSVAERGRGQLWS